MEFSCKACGSPAVVYPNNLRDDAPIRCQRCGVVVCTVGEFRLYAEGVSAHGMGFDGGRPGQDSPTEASSEALDI